MTSTDDPLSYIDYNNHCISELVVTEDCVKTVISQLNNSAPGHDGLPPLTIMSMLYLLHISSTCQQSKEIFQMNSN